MSIKELVSSRQDTKTSEFIPHNEVVGWAQGPHGLSRPVTAVVVGRDMEGVVTTEEGETKMRITSYIKSSGNEYPLKQIKEATEHKGWSGKEFKITEDVSIEYALGLEYSKQNPVSEETARLLLPLIPTFLTVREGSSDTQVPHTALLAHQG